MADREKVMCGLLNCGTPEKRCEECPYYDYYSSCLDVLCADARTLLLTQEPRILDPEEIPDYDGAIYLEDFDKPEIVASVYGGRVAGRVISGLDEKYLGRVKFIIRGDRPIVASFGDYNKRWRAWTFRPDDVQREGASWND